MTLASNILALTGPKLSGMAVDAIHGKGNVEFPKVFFLLWYDACLLRISALLNGCCPGLDPPQPEDRPADALGRIPPSD